MIFWMFGRRVRVDLERVTKELPEGHLTGLRITLGKLAGLRTEPDRDRGALVALRGGHKTSVAHPVNTLSLHRSATAEYRRLQRHALTADEMPVWDEVLRWAVSNQDTNPKA